MKFQSLPSKKVNKTQPRAYAVKTQAKEYIPTTHNSTRPNIWLDSKSESKSTLTSPNFIFQNIVKKPQNTLQIP